jgi:hypothetical protein
MPGPVLHLGAVVTCSHGGQAVPTAPVPRVLVSGQPVATMPVPYAIAGCTFTPPCVTGTWVVGALRVTAMGQPLALQTGVSVCAPNGTPMVPSFVQARVLAT